MNQTNSNRLRWGILGAANIAQKNWQSIQDSGSGVVTAVASRSVDRAQEFIQICQASAPQTSSPVALASYDELIARPDVDAIYIPLPTGLRKEWVIKAARAGKHVLCEKPCAPNLPDLLEMTRVCETAGVQFGDGVMFVHSSRLEALRSVLDTAGAIGQIRRIASGFSFNGGTDFAAANIRMHSGLEPHGCLGDLGWYCIRFGLWAMRWQQPERVIGRILNEAGCPGSPAPVPTEFSAELFFPGGVSMTFYCSFITHDQQWAHVSGTEGSLRVDDFVLPFFGDEARFETFQPNFRVEGCRFNMESHRRTHVVPEYSNNHPTSQEAALFRNFAAAVQNPSARAAWTEAAVKTQRVMEACLDSARNGSRPVAL